MTARLLSHQKVTLSDSRYGHSQQLYPGNHVHDVEKTISHLRKNIVGFLVAAPLDWGMGTEIGGNISKTKTIDIAQIDLQPSERERSRV
jgi:hypothetical protein